MPPVLRVVTASLLVAVTAGGVGLCVGCGSGSGGFNGSQVKDAPPMSPEQQKAFDRYYKRDQKKPQKNPGVGGRQPVVRS